MSDRVPECPKCGKAMEEGFILDRTDGAPRQSEWIEGALERRFWGVKLSGHRQLPVTTFRCPKCGYLESYAPLA